MSLALTEEKAREIEALCQIARENGAVISLREIIGLADIDASEHELANAFSSDSLLRSRFLLESGYVMERRAEEDPGRMVAVEEERRGRARANLRTAYAFGRSLLGGTTVVSVSGGNSYLSASEDEDIDFFCVTRTSGMWLFMLKALALARIHRLADGGSPELCFSCIMDESWATKEFRERQHPIFARDALTAKVIGGEAAYHALLEEAAWMGGYFPSFYGMRLRETEGVEGAEHRAGRGSPVLNAFLFHTLGSFLRLKSWALNRRLAKAGWRSSAFTTRIGKGHYIYESTRYRKLRKMYDVLGREA